MSTFSKTIIVGRLGQNPEDVQYTRNGTPVLTISVATEHRYKRDDEFVSDTEWHRVRVWGKTAENCKRFLSKGRQVCVEGRNKTEKWEKDGITRYTTIVVAESVQFLGDSPKDESHQTQPAQGPDDPAEKQGWGS